MGLDVVAQPGWSGKRPLFTDPAGDGVYARLKQLRAASRLPYRTRISRKSRAAQQASSDVRIIPIVPSASSFSASGDSSSMGSGNSSSEIYEKLLDAPSIPQSDPNEMDHIHDMYDQLADAPNVRETVLDRRLKLARNTYSTDLTEATRMLNTLDQLVHAPSLPDAQLPPRSPVNSVTKNMLDALDDISNGKAVPPSEPAAPTPHSEPAAPTVDAMERYRARLEAERKAELQNMHPSTSVASARQQLIDAINKPGSQSTRLNAQSELHNLVNAHEFARRKQELATLLNNIGKSAPMQGVTQSTPGSQVATLKEQLFPSASGNGSSGSSSSAPADMEGVINDPFTFSATSSRAPGPPGPPIIGKKRLRDDKSDEFVIELNRLIRDELLHAHNNREREEAEHARNLDQHFNEERNAWAEQAKQKALATFQQFEVEHNADNEREAHARANEINKRIKQTQEAYARANTINERIRADKAFEQSKNAIKRIEENYRTNPVVTPLERIEDLDDLLDDLFDDEAEMARLRGHRS